MNSAPLSAPPSAGSTLAALAHAVGDALSPYDLARKALALLLPAVGGDAGAVVVGLDEKRRVIARADENVEESASRASAPLVAAGRAVGSIECSARRADAFSAGAVELLRAAGAMLGPPLTFDGVATDVLQNLLELRALHAVADAVSRSLDLEELLGRCLDIAQEVSHAPAGALYLFDERRSTLVRAGVRGVPDEIAPPEVPVGALPPRFQTASQVINIDDPEEENHPAVHAARRGVLRRILLLPLRVEDRLVGLLALHFFDPVDFAPSTVRTLEAITGQQAVVIENARAQRLVELRARLALMLREFGEKALAPREELDTHQLILETAIQISRGDRALIARVTGDVSRVVAGYGVDDNLPGMEVPLSEPNLATAAASNDPVVIEDARTIDPETVIGRLVRAKGTASLMLLTMRHQGRVIAQLYTGSGERRRYEAEEIEAMCILASMAAEVMERARVQAIVRAEHRRLDTILEQLPVVISVLAPDGTSLHSNQASRAFAEEFGLDAGDWRVGMQHIRNFYLDGTEIPYEELLIVQAFEGQSPPPQELIVQNEAGDKRKNVIAVAVPLCDERGQVEAVAVTFQDVTALRDLADAKDRFLRVASHELRSPITSLRATLSLLEMDPTAVSDEHRRATLLARVQRQVDRLIKLVEQLLDSARLNSRELPLETSECDLVALCEQAIDHAPTLATGHRVLLEQEGPVSGRWDAVRVEQVVTNLIANALRYSASGSVVTVRVRSEGERAIIEVSDEGIGIPEDQLDRVFTPFFRATNATTLHKGGLGLGLHITAEIVRRHGGEIRVSSRVGVGSTFSVELPRSPRT